MMPRRIAEPSLRAEWLADTELRARLERFVRRRLSEDDTLDVVQATVADALASPNAPDDPEGFRRFVFVLARNKVADHFRRLGRETPEAEADELMCGEPDPVSTRDLLRWAELELKSSEDKHTLEWMLREADGDKLEHIAEEAELPAPRVRQRVSRLRRYLRSRWAAQLAAAGLAVGCLLLGYAYWARHRGSAPPEIAREPTERLERARNLRKLAFERCAARDFSGCLEHLDEAKKLDPSGDSNLDVQEARRAAAEARRAAPLPSSLPQIAPSASPAPSPSEVPLPAPSSENAQAPAPKRVTPTAPQRNVTKKGANENSKNALPLKDGNVAPKLPPNDAPQQVKQ